MLDAPSPGAVHWVGMSGDAKKSPGGAPSSPFERTVAIEPTAAPSPERRNTAVLTPEAQVQGAAVAAQIPPNAATQAHYVAPPAPPTPASSGVHPRSSTLVMEPAAPSPPAAPTFGAPPPAPAIRKNPLEGMSFTGTAVVDASDEVKRARERLRIGDARATQLGAARLSAAAEPPTSTRAPFRITPPSPESDRESRPTLPPWMETSAVKAAPMRHPLERTQETSPMADVFEKVVPGLAPTPAGQEVWQPPARAEKVGGAAAAEETLPSPIAAPPAVKDDAYRPAGTPIVAPPPPPVAVPGDAAGPAPSPWGRDLPVAEPTFDSAKPYKPEAPKVQERKSVTGGLYSKFGKK